jgi:hypothetical protein
MSNNWMARFWGVIIRPQTYLNLAYLFLAFPLGVVYFVFFVTGLALGFPLIIVWVGLIILAVVFAAAWALTIFERQMAIWLLKVDIGPLGDPSDPNDDIWQRFKRYIGNPVTWKGLVFLLLKFPLGTFSFTLGTSLVVTGLALVFSPLMLLFFPNAQVHFFNLEVHPAVAVAFGFVLGVLLVPISLHIMNGLAYVYGQIARILLGKLEPAKAMTPAVVPPAPAAPAAVEVPAPVNAEPVTEEPKVVEMPAASPEEAVATEPEQSLDELFPATLDESAPSEPPAQS